MPPSIRAIGLAVLSALSLSVYAVDATVLKPPTGAKVAIAVFADLQTPECASAYPLIREAAEAHKVPVMLYDFPLPRHNWAFDAAVWARYFGTQDTRTLKVGNEFRRFIYSNQNQISRENLAQWVQKFAAEHNVALPAAKDPDGKLAEKVRADFALGQRIGVEHPPTIWVISNSGVSQPIVEELKDREQLSRLIEGMLKNAGPVAAVRSAPARRTAVSRAPKSSNHGAKP